MTTTAELHDVIARRLAEAGVGMYRPAGTYGPDDVGITLKVVPAAPDRVIAVTVYDIAQSPDPDNPVRVFGVQLRQRAGTHPTEVDTIADLAHDAMTVHHAVWDGVRVARCHRTNFAPLGADENGRQERTDNYELILG